MVASIPLPPLSGPHGTDMARIEFTRRARRILDNDHADDVVRRLQLRLGTERTTKIGPPDMGSNPYRTVFSTLSTMYDRWPSVNGLPGSEQRRSWPRRPTCGP